MTLRERVSKDITILIRLHDKLPEFAPERKPLQRQILFLMDYVKAAEFEESFQ